MHTFGEFDLKVDGETVDFPRAKARELLAYLIDRQGYSVSRANVFAVLFEDKQYDRSMQKQLDVIIRSLRETLRKIDAEDIFLKTAGYPIKNRIPCRLVFLSVLLYFNHCNVLFVRAYPFRFAF